MVAETSPATNIRYLLMLMLKGMIANLPKAAEGISSRVLNLFEYQLSPKKEVQTSVPYCTLWTAITGPECKAQL